MSEEYLTFNKCGQWELHKATNANTSDEVRPHSDESDNNEPFKARNKSNLDGNLPKDNGRKGWLHDANGGDVPKGGRVDIKQVTKPARNMQSQFTARNPGVGN